MSGVGSRRARGLVAAGAVAVAALSAPAAWASGACAWRLGTAAPGLASGLTAGAHTGVPDSVAQELRETLIGQGTSGASGEPEAAREPSHAPARAGGLSLGEADEELLCRIAMAEAGDQDTEGKALVMLVVLNRVADPRFPGTVGEVIFQPRQFSPVLEGTFWAAEPDADCRRALGMVESGWDGSQGALYFESRGASTWHRDHLRLLFRHGGHYFYGERGD